MKDVTIRRDEMGLWWLRFTAYHEVKRGYYGAEILETKVLKKEFPHKTWEQAMETCATIYRQWNDYKRKR